MSNRARTPSRSAGNPGTGLWSTKSSPRIFCATATSWLPDWYSSTNRRTTAAGDSDTAWLPSWRPPDSSRPGPRITRSGRGVEHERRPRAVAEQPGDGLLEGTGPLVLVGAHGGVVGVHERGVGFGTGERGERARHRGVALDPFRAEHVGDQPRGLGL